MDERAIPFQELDIRAEGKDAFGQFYRNKRSAVFRGKEGIEFPIFTDDTSIRQGVGVVLAYLHAGTKLDGFIGRSELSHGWMDGIHVSEGDPSLADDLVTVLSYIKKNGLNLQLDTDGRNASVLEKLLERQLGDRVIMEVKGPLTLYAGILNKEIDPEEIKSTLRLVAKFPEYRFQTTVAPVVRQEQGTQAICYVKKPECPALPSGDESGFFHRRSPVLPHGVLHLTPEEIVETAKLIQEVTGSNKQPYLLRLFDPGQCSDDRLKVVEKMSPNALFTYRSAARRHQVLTEIEKS
jgi:pyruvate formate lyase activating enzyme